ncbi:hypothetical protein F4780DRAFT_752978 [Xylariomycetidae sp. FL0641]|nr:hypothetical protein F4780DRAFT_752978 [Xylariomycetidae sp. FL0641]
MAPSLHDDLAARAFAAGGQQRQNRPSLLDLLGAEDNFDEPKPIWNNSTFIVVLTACILALSSACIIFRLYVRLFVVRMPGWDDLFVFLYLLTGIAGSVCLCLAPQYGLGRHFLALSLEEVAQYLKVFYVSIATHMTSTLLIKLSLLFQYLRMFRKNGPARTICILLLVLTAAWGIAFAFLAWLPCLPLANYWNAQDWGGKCYGFGSLDADTFFATFATQTSTNMVLDIFVWSVPLPLYWRRDTSPRTRLGLLGLFFMGAIGTALGVWRFVTIFEHRAATSPTFDPSWYSPISLMLGMLEVSVAGICGSVPVFWPILSARVNEIFVTREITVVRTERFANRYDDDDQVELDERKGSGRWNRRSFDIRDSRFSHHKKGGRDGWLADRKKHYADDFILDQVDPLRWQSNEAKFAIESNVVAAPRTKSTWPAF